MKTIDKKKAIQSHFGTVPDGIPGDHTWDVFYRGVFGEKVAFPYELHAWKVDMFLGQPNQFRVACNNGHTSVKTEDYPFSGSGTFYDYATGMVCSLLKDPVNGVIGTYACRSWAGFPETVLCFDGQKVIAKTAFYESELRDMKWFIGGYDVINLNPSREGFSKFQHNYKWYDYSGPTLTAWHNCIGVDRMGTLHFFKCYGNAKKLQQVAKNLMLVACICLDGGSPHSFNSPGVKKETKKFINNIIYFKK